jgi:hypothetical protein
MWGILFLGTGLVAFLTAIVFPGKCEEEEENGGGGDDNDCNFSHGVRMFAAAAEGLAGGSMMACIRCVMFVCCLLYVYH